jgi:aerobic-type carbon monoxide dehydrogenase small subunit (CoxS/CutS family)
MLAADAEGHEITTVEGLGTPEEMNPVQKAFVEKDALQCGFCTPGFVVSSTALLNKNPDPSIEEIKDGLAGNLCRCGTYSRVFEAVQKAARG